MLYVNTRATSSMSPLPVDYIDRGCYAGEQPE